MAAHTIPDPMPIFAMFALVPIKLSLSNYLLWYSQFQPLLDCFELRSLIDGSSPKPSELLTSDAGVTTPNPAFSQWKIKDQKLLGVIFATLTEEAMAEVVGCRDSRSAWAALEVAFAHSSESRANQLRAELLGLRRDTLSVSDYSRKFRTLCDQLSSIGHPVRETDKCHSFLRGLGAQYLGFSDTHMAMSPIPPFRDLVNHAIQYEQMLQAVQPSLPSPQAAFYSSKSTPSSGRNST